MRLNRVNSAIDRNERNKINENFDILERTYGKTAIDAETAKERATYAKEKADSVQAQFNQVIIEGDSSVEAAQARVGVDSTEYNTLKERLDMENEQVTQQLAQISELLPPSDGIDDTLALQSKFSAISNKTLTLTDNYIIGTPSTVASTNTCLYIVGQSNFKIKNNGGSIKLKDGTNNKTMLVIADCSNFEIDGVLFDGNKENQTLVQSSTARFLSENCPTILIENCNDYMITNNYFKNSQGDGIQIDVNYLNQTNTSNRQSNNGVIFNNTFEAVGRNGISCVHTKNHEIHGNTFKNIRLYTTTLAAGVDVETNGVYNYKNENIKVYANYFIDCDKGVQVMTAYGDDWTENIEIVDNTFVTCKDATYLIQLRNENAKNIIIARNSYLNCNNGISGDRVFTGVIRENSILNCKRTNITNGYGIVFGSNLNDPNGGLLIKGNTIYKCEADSIFLKRTSSTLILENTINAEADASLTEKSGIRLLQDISDIQILKNTFKGSAFPIFVSDSGGAVQNVLIADNDATTAKNIITNVVSSSTTIATKSNRLNGIVKYEATGITKTISSLLVPANGTFNYDTEIVYADNLRSILVTPRSDTGSLIIQPYLTGGRFYIRFINPTSDTIAFTPLTLNITTYNNN